MLARCRMWTHDIRFDTHTFFQGLMFIQGSMSSINGNDIERNKATLMILVKEANPVINV